MSSPDLIAPDRLESLLAGDPPESVREAVVQGLVRELRASAPVAPASLRARVLAERPPVLRRVSRRRLGVALVAAALLAVAGVVAVASRSGGERADATKSNQVADVPNSNLSGGDVDESVHGGVPAPAFEEYSWQKRAFSLDRVFKSSSATPLPTAAGDILTESASQPAISRDGARARDVKMAMELRVRDADELSDAAQEAMDVTSKLGGVVAASKVDTTGARGTATLQLQIPVGKLDQAVAELSQLGTITAQDVTARDLQGAVDKTVSRIRNLRAAIAADKLRLESGTLTSEQELATKLRLIRERQALDQVWRERAAYLAEAGSAELTLGLHTGKATSVGATHGRFYDTLASGLSALSQIAAVALIVLIAAAPLILIGLVVWLAGRSRRRRIEAEILNRPRPAAPSSPPSA